MGPRNADIRNQIKKLNEDGHKISTHKVVVINNQIVISGTQNVLNTSAEWTKWQFDYL